MTRARFHLAKVECSLRQSLLGIDGRAQPCHRRRGGGPGRRPIQRHSPGGAMELPLLRAQAGGPAWRARGVHSGGAGTASRPAIGSRVLEEFPGQKMVQNVRLYRWLEASVFAEIKMNRSVCLMGG